MKKNMIKGVFAASIVLSMLSCNNIADSTFVSDSVTVSRASGVAESVVETAVLTSDLNPGFCKAVYFTGDFENTGDMHTSRKYGDAGSQSKNLVLQITEVHIH